MTEKAARALHAADWDEFGHASPTSTGTAEGDWDALGPKQKQDYRWRGRAVLEAIREPSAAMLNAEHPHRIDGANHLSQGTARAVWQSMIDAALKPEAWP